MDLILLASLASIECLLTDLSSIIIGHLHLKDPIKGAFIIYIEGGLSWFWRGSLFFPTMISGGLWKISNKNDIKHRGVRPFFSWKGYENMLLDALIIPVFYFISRKCWYRTRVWKLMHDTHFLCYKISVSGSNLLSSPSSLLCSLHSLSSLSCSPRVERWLARWYRLLCSGLMKITRVL